VTDRELRYKLLSEADASARAEMVENEMTRLQRLLRLAASQKPEDWPKGCSWN
jgi:hypothetical protein